MKGSVIKRMYAGFALIIIMFVISTIMTMRGMQQIHTNFGSVSNTALPLVSQSNQTSVYLLSADKLFKDFLTTQSPERMGEIRGQFEEAKNRYAQALQDLAKASDGNTELLASIEKLKDMEVRYFTEADAAMDNYRNMFVAQAEVQKSSRRFQRLHSELGIGMKEYVDDQSSISVKVMAKSYFIKLRDAEVITSDALASNNLELVNKAVAKNKKAVTHLNYAYRGLTTQMPEIK